MYEESTVGPLVIHLVSRSSGEGKTLVGEKLIAKLRSKGVEPCAVKHTHHTLDVRGKDTHRLHAAGSRLTLALGPGELLVKASRNQELGELLVLLARFLSDRCKVIIVEGLREGLPQPLEEASEGVLRVEVASLRPSNVAWVKRPSRGQGDFVEVVEDAVRGLGDESLGKKNHVG